MKNLVKLGTLTSIRTGKLDANASSENGKYPFFTCSKEPLRIDSYSYNCECVLVAGNGDLNVKYYDGKFDAYQRTYIIESTDKSKLLVKYLYFFLDIYVEVLRTQSIGGVIKYIKLGNLTDAMIPLPCIEEQEVIVDRLEKCNDLLNRRIRQLAILDQLVKSRFVELFGDPAMNTKGWEIEKAEKHIDLLSGFPFDSSHYTECGIKICGGLIIMPQRIDWDSCKYWSSIEGFEEYTLRENDIVMALDRPWISEGFKVAMVDADELPALLIQRTARIRAVDINQHYLMYCFILGGFDNHCNVTGSLVPHISAKDIRSFPIMLPSIELQEQFSTFVEQTNKSKVAIQAALDKTQLLFDSLMQKYFG